MLLATLLAQGALGAIKQPVAAFTLEDFKQLVEKNDATTPEAVLALLPAEFRQNVTFVFHSNSLQQGSKEAPRAILWDETGQFVLTLNGSSAQRGHDAFEMLQVDPKTDQIHFYKIGFPLKKNFGHSVAEIQEPAECLNCHGRNPRPIWKEYPNWEGVYGSRDDSLEGDEKGDYEKFIKTARNHPIYSQLFPDGKSSEWHPLFPYRPDAKASAIRMETGFAYRPNLRLSSFLARMQVRRLTRAIVDTTEFGSKLEGFARAMMGCDGGKDSNAALGFFPELGMTKADFDLSDPYYASANDRLDFTASYFDGSATLNEMMTATILAKIGEKNAAVRAAFYSRGLMDKYKHASARNQADWSLFQILDQQGRWFALPYMRDPYTRQIQKREFFTGIFRTQFNSVCSALGHASPDPSRARRVAAPAHLKSPSDLLKENCASCHHGGDAPQIPFDQPEELKAKLQKDGVAFVEKVGLRMEPSTIYDQRMPFGSAPLSLEERQDILKYLREMQK